MLLRYFYDKTLAHASYLVGCQKTKEAIVVDPGRDIQQYLDAARQEGVSIVAAAETHIHADYVSGACELADRVDAKLFVSDEGPAEWKYSFAGDSKSQLLHDGDTFLIGRIKFEVMHTPGHTPESISFILTDVGAGAMQPMGIFTGDFVFVGSIGRPDLLEEAAGIEGTAEPGARDLFRSVARFRDLPDYLQVWPAHGAGSACGKGLGAIPSSTVGYEKLFNPALQIHHEQEFVDYILADQPEAPKYFAVMKRVNKEGPAVLGAEDAPEVLNVSGLAAALEQGMVLDLSPASQFAAQHVPGTINIPDGMLARWAGWFVDYHRPLHVIATARQIPEAFRVLRKMGIDNLVGFFDNDRVTAAGFKTEAYPSAGPEEMRASIERNEVTLVDVRSQVEWDRGHIPQAQHLFLGYLLDQGRQLIQGDKPIVVQCQLGARAAIAASVLQSLGADVTNLAGGFEAWESAGLPTSLASGLEAAARTSTGDLHRPRV
jgi:hydroxyacylglutathione hydrolase